VTQYLVDLLCFKQRWSPAAQIDAVCLDLAPKTLFPQGNFPQQSVKVALLAASGPGPLKKRTIWTGAEAEGEVEIYR